MYADAVDLRRFDKLRSHTLEEMFKLAQLESQVASGVSSGMGMGMQALNKESEGDKVGPIVNNNSTSNLKDGS
jgi:hypothetical protein